MLTGKNARDAIDYIIFKSVASQKYTHDKTETLVHIIWRKGVHIEPENRVHNAGIGSHIQKKMWRPGIKLNMN